MMLSLKPKSNRRSARFGTMGTFVLVVAYLQARIVGHGRITKTECLAYYDNQEDMCVDYQ